MHDVFQPVAAVMTKLQSIFLPPWKTYPYVEKVIEWLTNASIECSQIGDMEYFPTMRENKEVSSSFLCLNIWVYVCDLVMNVSNAPALQPVLDCQN